MSSVSSVNNSYSVPVSSTSALSSVSLSDLSTQSLTNASGNLSAMQQDYAAVSSRSNAYGTLISALQTFIGQVPSFQDQTQVAGLTASSNSNLIGVTIGRQSVAGVYNVSVNQLAQGQINKTASSTSATVAGAYGTGNLTIKAGNNAAVAISVTATMTPTDLANAINNAKAGVTAQVIGSGTSYAVQVSGNVIGAANAVTYTESGTVNTGLNANLVQAAQDANYTVNGKSYTSSSNTALNGVPGVAMKFTGTVSNATVTVGASAATVASSLTTFVANYNTIITALNTAASSDGLVSNAALNAMKMKLSRVMGNVSTGASGGFRSLGDVGIVRNSDGTYAVNSNILAAAASSNASSVANLITGTVLGTNGLAADLDAVITSSGEPGVSTLGKVGYSLNKNLLRIARRASQEQSRIDTLAKGIEGNYRNLQVALSKYAAQSMVVSALTAQTGISTEGFDLTQTR